MWPFRRKRGRFKAVQADLAEIRATLAKLEATLMALDFTSLRASVDGAKAHMGDLMEKLAAAVEAAQTPQIVEVEKLVEVIKEVPVEVIVETMVTDPADQAQIDAMAAELKASFPPVVQVDPPIESVDPVVEVPAEPAPQPEPIP